MPCQGTVDLLVNSSGLTHKCLRRDWVTLSVRVKAEMRVGTTLSFGIKAQMSEYKIEPQSLSHEVTTQLRARVTVRSWDRKSEGWSWDRKSEGFSQPRAFSEQ